MQNLDLDKDQRLPAHIARGGQNVYGASLGILMLETSFPRIAGDVGHAASWPFPVHYKVVRGATAEKVVKHNADGLLQSFIDAGQELIDMGVDGISTTCGFLSLHQKELASALSVPVASSSLMQIPLVQAMLPADKKVGVITIASDSLTAAHLAAVNADVNTPIVGTENGKEFSKAMLDGDQYLDIRQSCEDIIEAGKELVENHPEVGAIVLECTNMVAYAEPLQRALGIPIYSIYSFLCWFQAGLRPHQFLTAEQM